MAKNPKRPRDPNELAKLIVDIATGDAADSPKINKDSHAVELGKKGGKSRADKLSAEKRKEISKKAAQARWGKKRNK